MLAIRVAIVFALLLAGCDPAVPASQPPEPPDLPARSETDTPPTTAEATLRANPEANLSVGDQVEVCWKAPGRSDCTLSILHASGEGDFGDVAASGCRPVIMERTTLIELFCANNTHALLQLDTEE